MNHPKAGQAASLAAPSPEPGREPTWLLRWTIVALLMAAVVINYIDRQTLSVLAPKLLEQFRLTNTQFGWIVFSFSLAYMAGAPLAGRFLDRVGVRAGLALAVVVWSAVAGAHVAARGLLSFCVLRFALGLSEAAIFPAGIKGARKILPLAERATGLGLVFSGASTGSSLAPPLVVPLALGFGWRWAFLVTGSLGFLWLACWWMASGARGAEALRSEDHAAAKEAAAGSSESLVKNPRLWAFLVGVFCVAWPIAFGYNWLAIYVVKARGMSLAQVGHLLWIPYISSHVGTIGMGWLSGRLIRRGWDTLSARRSILMICGFVPLLYLAIPGLRENWAVLAFFSLAGMAQGGLYTLYYTYITDRFPSSQAGLLTGLGTMAYSACATLSGPAIGWTVDHFSFTPALFLCGLLPLVGSLSWYALGGREGAGKNKAV